jgi:hypothetical protein
MELAPRDYAERSERVSVEGRAGKREKRISSSSNKLHISFLFTFQAQVPTYTAQIVVSMKSRLRTPAIFCAVERQNEEALEGRGMREMQTKFW